jgi:hypothetical protein
LEYRVIEVRSQAETKDDFSSSFCFQTGSGTLPAPVQWVPGVIFPGLKRGQGETLTTDLI